MTEATLERILQTEPDEEKVAQAVREYREQYYRAGEEDKQKICNLLCITLKATRSQSDLQVLIYHPESEMVTIAYSEGGTSVNVACDSGIAMIRDILRAMQ